MVNYFMKLGQMAKFIDLPTSPHELIALAANHFPGKVRGAMIMAKSNSFKDMLQLTEGLARKYDEQYPENTGDNLPRRVEASAFMQEEWTQCPDVSSNNWTPPMAMHLE